MGFLNDWIFYNSGNECPERFWRWAGISLLGHIAGRKIHYMHGFIPITPPLYVGLIGDAGSGKSTAKSEVKSIVVEHFGAAQNGSIQRGPLLYSASIQSREDIAKKMAQPDAEIIWKKPDGQLDSYRAFYVIANEFENFLSVDRQRMVAFLVDIFDEKWFSTGFKNSESQSFSNPHFSILSCGTPKWLMMELKMDLFDGGLGRRLTLVCDESTGVEPDPSRPSGWEAAKSRCVDILKRIEQRQGCFERSALGKKWWHEWYVKHKKERPTDPILAQFAATKHVMVMKVAMSLALADNPDKLILTDEHFESARFLFDDLMPSIQKLTAGIGRSEVAGIGVMLLSFVERLGGMIKFTQVRIHFQRYLNRREFWDVLQDFMDTKQLKMVEFDTSGVVEKWIGTPEKVDATLAAIEKKKRERTLGEQK